MFTEFTEIIEPLSSTKTDTCSTKNILEIGCGVGNSVFPIVEHCKNDNVFVYGCDFSENAVNILKEHEEYKPDRYMSFTLSIPTLDHKLFKGEKNILENMLPF